MALLSVEELQVAYGRIEAVRDASFTVSEGEFVGIIGANGAGKSTTLHAIAGVIPARGGQILYRGQSIRNSAPEQIVRMGISLVPEGRQVFVRMTVEENLLLAARSLGRRSPRDFDEVLERFPILGAYRKKPAGQLSGGEQQQLVIGRALLTRPELLMLDEPSLGLAPRLVSQVFAVLLELREGGTTILLVEQNAAKTLEAADRVYVMRNGKMGELDVRSEGLTDRDLLDAYLGARHTRGSGEAEII